MILELVDKDDPVMKTPSAPFDFKTPPMDPTELYENLRDTMIHHHGVGLSACQVGIPYNVFVIGNPGDINSIFSVFNPRIVNASGDVSMEEGCLTYPGLFVKVKRHEKIKARFSGHDGLIDTMDFTGYSARIFQHEYDHLQGINFTQVASRLQLDRAKKQKLKLDRLRKRALQKA